MRVDVSLGVFRKIIPSFDLLDPSAPTDKELQEKFEKRLIVEQVAHPFSFYKKFLLSGSIKNIKFFLFFQDISILKYI